MKRDRTDAGIGGARVGVPAGARRLAVWCLASLAAGVAAGVLLPRAPDGGAAAVGQAPAAADPGGATAARSAAGGHVPAGAGGGTAPGSAAAAPVPADDAVPGSPGGRGVPDASAMPLEDPAVPKEVDGPWGHLRHLGLWLFPPPGNVAPAQCPSVAPPWRFPGRGKADLERLLDVPGMDAAARHALLRNARCDAAGCVVPPPADGGRRLPPEARAAVYGEQARQPEGEWAPLVLRLWPGDFDLWLSEAGLPPATVGEIRRLSFPLGSFRAVADLPLLCAGAPGPDERSALARAWAFDRARLAKVRVQSGLDDPARLDAYWGRGVRRKDLGELFAATIRADQVTYVDVAHLLPFWVRGRLYTYPVPEDPPYNAFWTALNFRRGVPDPAPVDARGLEEALGRDYREVTDGTRMLGDVDVYRTPGGTVVHASVHVADGVAFTKNGGTALRPWILTREAVLARMYADGPGSQIRHYRLRGD